MPLPISHPPRLERAGLVAHIMALTHFLHRYSMDKLVASQRYPKLSLGFEGYITLLAEQDYAPSELAERLNISRQACSKVIKDLERNGLIQRHLDPRDSRSHRLTLTLKGHRLIQDGIELTNDLQRRFAEVAGSDILERVTGLLEQLCQALQVTVPRYQVLEAIGRTTQRQPQKLNVLLPILNDYFYESLVSSLSSKGFQGLKPNFSQVLGLIVLDQGRIQYIASLTGVTKQAIAAIANELEQLGYINKEADPHDKRQIILRLAPLGQRLLNASEQSIEELTLKLEAILGQSAFELVDNTLAELYIHGIEHQGLQGSLPVNIEQLSQQLLQELGPAGTRALAQHLMIITRGNI